MNPTPKPIIEKKSIKHTFTPAETAGLNIDFGNAYDAVKSAEADFDAVKAVHKSKITEAESKMTTLRATINAGFEYRETELQVVFYPVEKKKRYFAADADLKVDHKAAPILVEAMNPADFQADLIQAESIFESQTRLELWRAGESSGFLIVGRLLGSWYCALRGNIGNNKLGERLDSEQPCFKKRSDAIARAGKRCEAWITSAVGKEALPGFKDTIKKVVDAEAEKAE